MRLIAYRGVVSALLVVALSLIAGVSVSEASSVPRQGQLPDSPAQASGSLVGLVPSAGGVALVTWGGGPQSGLIEVAGAQGCAVTSLWVTDAGGRFIAYIVGAPDIANAEWVERYPGGELPAGAPFILLCDVGDPPTTEPAPPPAAQEPPALTGDLPSAGGFGLVVWSGGPVDSLVSSATARGCDVSALWSNNAAGEFISYIPGALPVANAAWGERFPGGTMPGASAVVVACRAEDDLASMSLEEKIGQLIFAGIPGTEAGAQARYLIEDLHIGNIVLMGHNAGTPAQVAGLTAALQQLAVASNGVGALISTDQEGGLVQRLQQGFTDLPEAAVVGEAGDSDLARRYGAMVGAELRAVGVNMNLAPVLDVNDNPANPVIGRRAFGTTPGAVINTALPFLEGLQSARVAATGKHFPGHGNTETDSHFTLPVVHKNRADLEATELAPFRAAVQAGIEAIMVAHVAYPALDPSGLPATLSSPIVTGLLREEIGYDGVIVTDDMGMAGVAALMPSEQAVVEAVKAGADLAICVGLPCEAPKAHAALLAAAESGELSMERVDDAVRRILALKASLEVESGALGDLATVGSAAHQAVVDEIVLAAGG